MGYLFFGGIQHSPVDGCSGGSCSFGVLAGGDERTSFYSVILPESVTGHGTTDWLQIRTGICQGCTLSPCLYNLYAEYIINARLDEAQAGIKIAGRNINNLRYVDDTTLMAESEEEIKSLWMKVKE